MKHVSLNYFVMILRSGRLLPTPPRQIPSRRHLPRIPIMGTNIPAMPLYTGATDPTLLFVKYEQYAKANNWDAAAKLSNFVLILDDTPLKFYNSLADDDKNDFAKLKKCFIARFGKDLSDRYSMLNIFTKTPISPDMSIEQYTELLTEAGTALTKTPQDIIDAILMGIPTPVRQHLISKEVKTITDVITQYKRFYAQNDSSPDELFNKLSALIDKKLNTYSNQLNAVHDHIRSSTQREHSSRSRRSPSPAFQGRGRSPQRVRFRLDNCPRCGRLHSRSARCPADGKTCNMCKKPNHFAKMCFAPRGRYSNLSQ